MDESKSVTVVAVKIPFLSLVWLITKIMLASLPALVLAGAIVFGLATALGMVPATLSEVLPAGKSQAPTSNYSACMKQANELESSVLKQQCAKRYLP